MGSGLQTRACEFLAVCKVWLVNIHTEDRTDSRPGRNRQTKHTVGWLHCGLIVTDQSATIFVKRF